MSIRTKPPAASYSTGSSVKRAASSCPRTPLARHVEQKAVSEPSQVNNLTATGVSATQIDVSWTAPDSDGDAAIDMYCVQVSANVAAT